MTAPEEPTRPAEPQSRPETRPELRIGDREREQAVAHLGTAFGEGRLELAEYDERVAAAYSAKTASDLLHLTADLPLATREHPASTDHSPAPSLGGNRRPRRPARESRISPDPDMPRWLRAVWLTYAAVVAVNLLIWLIVSVGNGEITYFWPIWVAGPWGVILLFRTLAYRMGRGSADR